MRLALSHNSYLYSLCVRRVSWSRLWRQARFVTFPSWCFLLCYRQRIKSSSRVRIHKILSVAWRNSCSTKRVTWKAAEKIPNNKNESYSYCTLAPISSEGHWSVRELELIMISLLWLLRVNVDLVFFVSGSFSTWLQFDRNANALFSNMHADDFMTAEMIIREHSSLSMYQKLSKTPVSASLTSLEKHSPQSHGTFSCTQEMKFAKWRETTIRISNVYYYFNHNCPVDVNCCKSIQPWDKKQSRSATCVVGNYTGR